jgi:hypothetical protein
MEYRLQKGCALYRRESDQCAWEYVGQLADLVDVWEKQAQIVEEVEIDPPIVVQSGPRKIGRPCIGAMPMTATQRTARYRARKKQAQE